jgi:HD superfamily phosphohydrolase
MMVHEKTGLSHVELTGELISGNIEILTEKDYEFVKNRRTVPGIIEKYGLIPKDVAALVTGLPDTDGSLKLEMFSGNESQQVFNPKVYLNQIIHGEIDADQIDYLLRDSHYTGIAHGIIDVDRLIQTMEIFNNDLVIHRRGLSAVEGMLVARSLMYSSIYFHKTVRIAELMLARAVESAWESGDKPDLNKMVDYDLLNYLDDTGGFPREIVRKLKYRRLYKKVYSLSTQEIDGDKKSILIELSDWEKLRERENEICDKFKIPRNKIIIDIPKSELALSEPRIKRTQVKIKDKGLKQLSSYSPLARALQIRPIPDWELMVAADREYQKEVEKKIEKYLFD